MNVAIVDPRERSLKRIVQFLLTCAEQKPEVKEIGLNQYLSPETSTPLSWTPFPKRSTAEERATAAAELAEHLYGEAEVWACAVPKAEVMFTLATYTSVDRTARPTTQFPFTVARTGDFSRGEEIDPANYVGAVQRFASDAMRISSGNMQEMINALQIDNAALRKELREQERARMEYLMEREKLLDGKAERDFRQKKEQFYLDLQERGAEMLISYIMKKVMAESGGAEVKRVSVSPEAVAKFARGLTPDQAQHAKPVVDAVISMMTPEEKEELRKLFSAGMTRPPPQMTPANGVAVAPPGEMT